jgi:signal transduction histidine kinase/PAS domain-containing protein
VTTLDTDEASAGPIWPSWRVITLAAVVLVWLGAAGSQLVVTWHGDRADLLLLVAGNALVSTAGAWLFHLRWLATWNRYDRRTRNAFLPMSAYFVFRLVAAASAIPEATLVSGDAVAWLLAQATAVTLLLVPVRDEFMAAERGQVLGSALAFGSAVAVTAVLVVVDRSGLPVGVQPVEVGLSVAFFGAAAILLIRRHDQGRDLWLGVATLMVGGSHAVLAMSRTPYDGSVMWGLLLFGIALATPIVGATGENATRLEDQGALKERLTRIRRRTEILLDTLPAVVLLVDRKHRLSYANRKACTLLDISLVSEPERSRAWLQRIHPHDRPLVHSAVASVLDRTGGVWENVIRVDDPGGGIQWLSVQMRQVADPTENRVLVQIVATEVTDLLLARQAAEAQQGRLSLLSNLAQSLAGEVEEERILERYLKTGQDVIPMTSLLLYRPLPGSGDLRLVASFGPGCEAFDHHRRHSLGSDDHPCKQAFDTGLHRSVEVAAVVRKRDAVGLEAAHGIRHLSFLPLLAAGGVIGVLATASNSPPKLAADETDLLTQIGFLLGGTIYVAQLVRELNEQRAVAFEASRLKSEFLANTSHELRTPLTAILGFLRLTIDGTIADPEKQREYLTIAHESAEKLLTIINDVLDLAKIEAGRLEVHQGPVKVRSIVEGVETLFRHQMKNRGITFATSIATRGLVLWADPDRTTQILTNLLSNAMKFTPANGAVEVVALPEDGVITFTVTDTGVGIADGEIDKVFSSFYQVDGSTTREHGGTGLGLTISRRLAELMGGTLDLASEGRDRGTTARLCLPEYRDQG